MNNQDASYTVHELFYAPKIHIKIYLQSKIYSLLPANLSIESIWVNLKTKGLILQHLNHEPNFRKSPTCKYEHVCGSVTG
jgi:hypothetical protein